MEVIKMRMTRVHKLKQYLKEHKLYIGVMFVFTLFLSILVSQVVLYADDFALHQKALTDDFNVVLNEFSHVYMRWGGGPTPGFAIMVLMIGLWFWKIAHVLMIAFSIHMVLNMIFSKEKNCDALRAIVATFIWCLLFLMNLSVARETLYWFDGAMAYVLPVFLAISYIYCCYQYIINHKTYHWWNYIGMAILGFFAGWNSPQAGAITVILAFAFIVWQKTITKEKINKLILFGNIWLLIGFLVLYFAPGNSGRMAEFPDYNTLNLIGKIFYRIDDVAYLVTKFDTYPSFNIPTYLMITSILLVSTVSLYKNKAKKVLLTKLSIGITVSYVVLFALYLFTDSSFVVHNFLPEIFNYDVVFDGGILRTLIMVFNYTYFIAFVFSLLHLAWVYTKNENNPLLLFMLLGAIGTQAMMLMSPYSPYRSTYITIFFFIVTTAILCMNLIKKGQKELLCFSLISSMYFYNIAYALFLTIIYVVMKLYKKEKWLLLGSILLLLLPTISTLYITFNGYHQNKKIHELNIEKIEQYKEKNQHGTLKLYKLIDESYAFTPIYSDIEWIRNDIIQYFDLKKDVKIKVIEYE